MKKHTVITLIAVLIVILSAVSTWGSSPQPGSVEDPVVTKSYVDDRIDQLTELILGTSDGTLPSYARDEIVRDVISQLESLSDPGARYTPVQAFNGDKIIGNEGTEIILRSGKAVAISTGQNGITDVTAGKDILNGTNIEKNHLIIIPRDDGRGVRVNWDDAWFLIKGGYEIH